MARDGSGNYSLPLPAVEPDEVISSTWANQTLSDIELALTESLPVSGERGMVGPFRLADGSASNPSFGFNSETATGLYRPGTNILGFSVSGGERMRIVGGNLIIGSTVDTGDNLQVEGNVRFKSGLNVLGSATVGGDLTITGQTNAGLLGFSDAAGNNIVINNNATVGGLLGAAGLGVAGDASVLGALTVGGNILAAGVDAGPSQFDSITTPTIQVDGASNLSTLAVSDTSTFTGAAGFQTVNSVAVNSTSVNAENISATAFVNGAVGQFTTSVSAPTVSTTVGTGTSSMNVGSGRTGDGGSVVNFLTSAGQLTYDFRLNRASGVNGTINLEQRGSGRCNFTFETGTEMRMSTGATGGFTYRATIPNLTQGTDYGVFGTSLSSVGNINNFIQNQALTTTQNYYSITRNATAGIGTHVFRVGGDAAVSGSAITALTITETAIVPNLQTQNLVGSAATPSYSFAGDPDTGFYRSGSNTLDFSTGGVRRLSIDSAGRAYTYSTGGELLTMATTGNNSLFNLDATTGTPNINNLSWYLTSAGSALLILRNDAKSGYVAPFQILRNATAGTGSISFRVGGTSETTGSDFEAGRFTYTEGQTQGKFVVGHTSADLFLNNADSAPTTNYQIYSIKTGSVGPATGLGTDGSNTSMVGFSRNNVAGKRILHSEVAGVSVANTTGAEKGRVEFRTKAAADAGVVVRATVDETAATFNVPLVHTLPINTTGNIVNGGIFNATANFTINTANIVAGGVYRIYNNTAGNIVITQGAGVSLRVSGGTTGNRTMPQNGFVIGHAVSATEIVFLGSMT